MIIFKAVAELRAEAARHYISFMWWVIEPIIHMSVYYIVFNLVLNHSGKDFVPFLLIGIIIWKWFVSTVNQGADSILNNIGLIRQVYLPKYLFPGAILITNTVRFFFVFALLLIFLIGYGILPSITWISLPILIITQFLLTAALSGIAAAFVPFLPDLKLLIDNFLILLFFLSGIFFYINDIPEPYRYYFMLNPMAILIDQYRLILLHGMWPDLSKMALLSLISISGIVIAQYLMFKFDHHFPKVIM